MKKLILMAIACFYASAAMSAAHTAAPATDKASPSKDTATVLPDDKAGNAGDKKAVKKITPEATKNAKDEADKTKAGKDTAASPTK